MKGARGNGGALPPATNPAAVCLGTRRRRPIRRSLAWFGLWLGRGAHARHGGRTGGLGEAREGPWRRWLYGGGSARRNTGVRAHGYWSALQATLASQKGRAGGGGPHRGSNRAAWGCRGVNVDGERQRRNGVEDEPLQGTPGSAGASRRSTWSLQRGSRVQDGRSTSGGKKTGDGVSYCDTPAYN